MHIRPAIFALLTVTLFASGTGCNKSESRAPQAAPTVLSPDTIASVHWFGKKRVGITFGAYYLSRIWQQPQSAQLERQTLVKLASAPGRWLPGGANLSPDACSRLWWMLNDLVQEESYLEIRATTNLEPSAINYQPDTVFAIRLNAAQAEQWRTNLPVVLEPLTGARAVMNPDQNGWALQAAGSRDVFQLTRAGDWTLVGVSADKDNSLRAEISDRIRRDGVPFVSAGTNLWLEADLDSQFLSLVTRHSSLSNLNFSLTGDGANVLTHARLTFNEPFATPLPGWRLPLDLLHDPLTSLTVARGFGPQLAAWPPWRDLQIGAPPDQLCLWSLAGSPYQLYLAAPSPRSQVAALCDHLMQNGNPWLATNGYIGFDRAADGNGVTWGNLPDIKPFIKFAGNDSPGWLYTGLFPDTNAVVLPPSAGLIHDILRRTNLVYYDWEVTGPRLQPSLQVAQTARLIARQPQLSLDSASLNWLGALIPRLGTSATIITRTGPAELTLIRRSTLGLTAFELHLLTGWLESPQFPR
jgi:hypothetical protein